MVDSPKPQDVETPESEYRVERPKSRRLNTRQKLGMGALLAGASVAALWVVWPTRQGIPEIEASGVTEFQSEDVVRHCPKPVLAVPVASVKRKGYAAGDWETK